MLARYGDITRWEIAVVSVPLTIAAGILTYFTARHSVQRQNPAQAANPQAAIMNKVMLYLFPLGVVAGGPFFPLAILIYWLSNNLWTLGQQWLVYRRIDAEEVEKKDAAIAQRQSLAPRPGQKPIRAKKDAAGTPAGATGSDAGAISNPVGSQRGDSDDPAESTPATPAAKPFRARGVERGAH